MQCATSAAASCLPSTLAARTGTATGVLGIISNFKSVLLAVGGHLVATWEHIMLSAVCTYHLIQFGLGSCIPPSLTAIFKPMWAVAVVTIYHLVPRLPALFAPPFKSIFPLIKWKITNVPFDWFTSDLHTTDQSFLNLRRDFKTTFCEMSLLFHFFCATSDVRFAKEVLLFAGLEIDQSIM